MAAAPPLHGRCALRAVPLPFRGLRQANTAVVEPLDRTLRTYTDTVSTYTQTPVSTGQNLKVKDSRLCCHSRPSLHKKPETQKRSHHHSMRPRQ